MPVMQKHYPDTRLFLWAAGVSFLGSLPPGTLNVSAANLTINNGLYGAIQFSAGVILVEMIMVRIALVAIKKVEGWFFNLFSLLGTFVILIMAFVSLYAAFHVQPAAIPFTGQKLFLSGLLLSLFNPFHLPFWIGWTTVLKSKRILTDAYNVYVMAIGAGTTLAFTAYILAGSFLIHLLRGQQHVLNGVVGIVLLITGLVQLYKTFKLCRSH
jgi:threonine/homoserine/homoserine lactone efflux protein